MTSFPRDVSHGVFVNDIELFVNVENLNRYNAKNRLVTSDICIVLAINLLDKHFLW